MTMTTTKRKQTSIGALFVACLLLSATPACLTEDDWEAYNKPGGMPCGSGEECHSGRCNSSGLCLLSLADLCAQDVECAGEVCIGYGDSPNRICSQDCLGVPCVRGVCVHEEEVAFCALPCGDDWDCAQSATCQVIEGQNVCWPLRPQE
jgi:hypothetical protein